MSAELDSGRFRALAPEEVRAARAGLARALRAALFLVTSLLLFLGALLGAGAAMHALRGPHQHHPCDGTTRETCM